MDQGKGLPGGGATRLMHVVDVVRRRFGEAIRDELADHPYTDVRRSELRLLLLIPDRGTSLTGLADEAGITKQSLGEFVDRLQRAGYVTLEVSGNDRRVKVVRPTARGRAASEQILAAGQAVEHTWRLAVGPERFDLMKDVLTELATQDPAPPLDSPAVASDPTAPTARTSPPAASVSGPRSGRHGPGDR